MDAKRKHLTATTERYHDKEDNDNINATNEGDQRVWDSVNRSFKQVQSVLDRNRALIQQVNENHQSRIPDNMVKNVALIQELNGNINSIVSMYSDLNSSFSNAVVRKERDDGIDGRS